MGRGPGLELLQPFALALLGGLVTSLVVVLLVVPGLYPAIAGLDPLPAPPDEVDADRQGPRDLSGHGSTGRHGSGEQS
jgi:hypothetical protein